METRLDFLTDFESWALFSAPGSDGGLDFRVNPRIQILSGGIGAQPGDGFVDAGAEGFSGV
jgi:hypothetical protein